MDRDKVIKGMEQFRSDFKPFCGGKADWERFDAGLAMLKEQESVEPILDSFLRKRCPSCKTLLKGKFCYECGQAVKWDA